MQPHRVCQPLEMCWFHGQRCSFLPLPDWNFVFYHECLHCCMWNVKDLFQTLTVYLFPFDATLCKTLIYLSSPSSFSWLPVPIFCTNRLLRSELRRQTLLARTVGWHIFFCSFYYDALYFFLQILISPLFFLLFFLKVFMCWLLFFVCKYQGFVSAVSIMRDFVPAIYDTTVVIPKDSPAPTMLRILKGQSSVVSTSTFNSVDPNCWDAINF